MICRFSQVEQKRCTHQMRVLCGNWLTQCHLTPILARVYWLRSRTHFHSACTECISNVLWRREFGWSSFVFLTMLFSLQESPVEEGKRHVPVRFYFEIPFGCQKCPVLRRKFVQPMNSLLINVFF